MIDIHSHILHEVDDGARNLEESLNMVQEAKSAGFTTVVSTSHYYLRHYETEEEIRQEKIEEIIEQLSPSLQNFDICIGSEIYVTRSMTELLKEHKASTINNTRYVLFELPFEHELPYLKDIIYDLLGHKYIPIIAHPERYRYVQKNPNMLIELIDMGVLFQSNFGSIMGFYGKDAKKVVKKLLQNNFIHFLGTDAHRQENIFTVIPECLEELGEIITQEKIEELTNINPQCVLQNEMVRIPKPTKIKKSLF